MMNDEILLSNKVSQDKDAYTLYRLVSYIIELNECFEHYLHLIYGKNS